MATKTSHNKKSSAVKRILSEAKELKDPTSDFATSPLDDNIFEWHFTLRGPPGTEFERGFYHGRILLPVEYPFRPPDVMILTPNGRFELNKKICLTFTGFHEEMWQPAWGIRTALIGVQAFMGARAEAAVGIGSLDYPAEERERLADLSGNWQCPVCQKSNKDTLPAAEGGLRIQEKLPDGLTIDASSTKKTVDETSDVKAGSATDDDKVGATADTSGQPLPTVVVQEASTFSASHGPTEKMMEQLVRSRLEAAQQHPSIHSSQVSTPRSVTPADLNVDESRFNKPTMTDKGKEKEGSTSSEQEFSIPTDSIQPERAGSTSSCTAQRQPFITFAGSSVNRSTATASSRQAHQRHARHPSSAEASARRLAALDRAIVTVICLLAALLIRRMLSAWT